MKGFTRGLNPNMGDLSNAWLIVEPGGDGAAPAVPPQAV